LGGFQTVDELGTGGEKNEGEEEAEQGGSQEEKGDAKAEEAGAEGEEKKTDEEKPKVESKNSKESNRRSKDEDSKSGSSRRSDKGKRSSEAEKKGAAKKSVKESPRKRREKTPVDLDKIVIKKRERKQQEEKSADEKVLVVRRPNSLMGRLAELRKGLPRPQVEPAEKSEEERTVVRRSLREKYKAEEKITEKIIGTAMESVFFEEAAAEELINKLLEEDRNSRKAHIDP